MKVIIINNKYKGLKLTYEIGKEYEISDAVAKEYVRKGLAVLHVKKIELPKVEKIEPKIVTKEPPIVNLVWENPPEIEKIEEKIVTKETPKRGRRKKL